MHWPLILVGVFIAAYFFNGWGNFLGYLGFLFFFAWNIYAFTNGKNMISLPKTIESVKSNGNHDARLFLFIFSLIMTLIIFAGYIYKNSNP